MGPTNAEQGYASAKEVAARTPFRQANEDALQFGVLLEGEVIVGSALGPVSKRIITIVEWLMSLVRKCMTGVLSAS